MGLESRLRYELNKIGVYYGSEVYIDNSVDGEVELRFSSAAPILEKRKIVKFLRKTKEFNPVWRGKRVILESMNWAGGKKR